MSRPHQVTNLEDLAKISYDAGYRAALEEAIKEADEFMSRWNYSLPVLRARLSELLKRMDEGKEEA